MIHWESKQERNAFRLLDCNPDVASFSEQPCKITYVMDGVKRSHVPDILVATGRGKELCEVKLRAEALEPDVHLRTAFLAHALPQWGYSYRVLYGEDLAKQPRLGNAIRLLNFGHHHVTECEQEFIRRALKQRGALVWSEACSGIYSARGREILCRLTLNGNLSMDMDAQWSPDTQFVPGKVGI